MIIAKQKREENIAEYVLYMWQLEDLLRAYNYDVESLVKGFTLSPLQMPAIKQWYQDMADAMKAEGIHKKGHLMQLKELVQDLSTLNIKLLQNPEEKKYKELFEAAMPHITEIINSSDGFVKNEIDACFTGLYGMMVLRLQKKEITEDTQKAVKTFSNLLGALSVRFKQYEKGELNIEL
ncbi:MAG: DUF4924 family protein [Bacteroidales bacterium]|nr:DUF4924 family protein [Bacteroidales bacterium]